MGVGLISSLMVGGINSGETISAETKILYELVEAELGQSANNLQIKKEEDDKTGETYVWVESNKGLYKYMVKYTGDTAVGLTEKLFVID